MKVLSIQRCRATPPFTVSLLLLLSCFFVTGCGRSETTDAQPSDAAAESSDSSVESVALDAKKVETVPNDLGDRESKPEGEGGQEADAPPETLGIGDRNPGLKIAKWIKGDPFSSELKEKVHVVEFWATWCPPCRAGMPHISELQAEYADEVAFVGVTQEDLETVESFLADESPSGVTWDEVVQYRLAIDDEGWTNQAYMQAAGQNGIPCAFIVGYDGVVEWIGHPGLIDEPLEKIVTKQWDREAAIADYKRQQRLQEVSSELTSLARSGKWDELLSKLDGIEKEVGKSFAISKFRLQVLLSADRIEEASKLREAIIEDAWDDANSLNEIAWAAATESDGKDRELALKAAKRASTLRDDQDASILDTVARCYYELGDLDEAIKWQELAVKHNEGTRSIEIALERYQAEKSESESEQ